MTSVQIIRHPAVTIERIFSDTFAGIAPGFIAAQILGTLLETGLVAVLYPQVARVADEVVVPDHNTTPTVD